MPTKQETFDTIYSHLMKQGRRATTGRDGYKGCVYRMHGPDWVRKCAAGCLIPDEFYSPTFEGHPVTPYGTNPVSELLAFLGHNLQLVHECQMVHDECEPHYWQGELQRVAEKFGLSIPCPQTA